MNKQYVRNSKRQKIGMITLEENGSKPIIGYSKCNKHDDFNRDLGEIVASVRGRHIIEAKSIDVPHDIKRAMPGFLQTFSNYLEGKQLPAWISDCLSNKGI